MKLYLKILIHAIFWLVYLMFSFVVGIAKMPDSWPALNNYSLHFIVNFIWAALAFYVFYFYFFKFFESKKFGLYLFLSIIISASITFLFLPVHKLILPQFDIWNRKIFAPPIAGTFIIVQCGCLVRGFENWFTNIQLKSELENKNLHNELELLKSQINPHFLFNSLNNIDSLIHTNSKNASTSLISLSEMLRYMIYETKVERVDLYKEIYYLQNYIKLQQLRYSPHDYIHYNFPDDCRNIFIAPLIFIPFVENAFKHSIDTGRYPVIDISVMCKDRSVLFTCINYCKTENLDMDRFGGVGIKNVTRRLELLYPKKHLIEISNENSTFKVELKIDLQ